MVEERGATATNPKMMPRQHIGSDSSRRYRCKRSGQERVMQGWWGAPGFRVPTGRRHGKRGTCKEQFGHGPNIGCISYNTCIRSTGDHLGIIPSKRAFRSGSSSTKEVVVHGSSWEVVVHGGEELDVSATRVFGDGSYACSNMKLGGTPTSWSLVSCETSLFNV